MKEKAKPTAPVIDNKTMYKFSYGLFVLTAREASFDNGCIINTAIQVTSNPKRVSIAVNKENKTHDMIVATGAFNLSILSEKASFSIFQQFGFQSGKTVNKFEDPGSAKRSANGIYYIIDGANSFLSGKVVEMHDLGTHTLFIADVTEAKVLDASQSCTYAYYQDNIKPKPGAPKTEGKVTWVCKVCGYVYEGEEIPEDFVCPLCKHGAQDFEKVVG